MWDPIHLFFKDSQIPRLDNIFVFLLSIMGWDLRPCDFLKVHADLWLYKNSNWPQDSSLFALAKWFHLEFNCVSAKHNYFSFLISCSYRFKSRQGMQSWYTE